MFFNLFEEINRLRKDINRLLIKGVSNIYLKSYEKTFSKLQFSKFNKFVTKSVFWEFQSTQISLNFKTFCCNLKSSGLGSKLWATFLFFDFERNYDVLKSKCPCILMNSNINFHKNEMESELQKPTNSFRETNLMLQLI